MKQSHITRIHGAPDWNAIPAICIDNVVKPPEARVRATAQICYDEDALHLRLSAEEENIRAEVTDPMGQT